MGMDCEHGIYLGKFCKLCEDQYQESYNKQKLKEDSILNELSTYGLKGSATPIYGEIVVKAKDVLSLLRIK